ncbi:MAG: hypothetical protein H7A55_24400 [Verrucomicrobiaceae bacterium]|nr:hypothetical protein [Verrucomicrobiaceae bacterium]
MIRRFVVLVFLSRCFASGEVLPVASDRQLFFDDRLIDPAHTKAVHREYHSPSDIQRVMTPERPSEALGFIFYASVIDDGGTLKLFHGSYDADKKKHFSLATSQDGIHFERPNLGLTEYQGNRANNILPVHAVEAGVFLDPHAQAEKRYRLLFTQNWPDPATAGVYVASSPDGIHWVTGANRVLPFAPDSQHAGFWDQRINKYVIYLRAWNSQRLRCVARAEVDDLENPWPLNASVPPFAIWGQDKVPTLSRELPVVMSPDGDDPENLQLYTSAAIPYPFAPNVYLAFPAAYHLFKGKEWKGRALNSNDGTFDVQLASSRDGIAWGRHRQPYIAAGYHDGLDLRLVSMAQGIVRRGRELYQYFIGWPHTHGRPVVWDKDLADRAEWLKQDLGGIYCATQRVDGFVSMSADDQDGVLTTRPLSFTGNRLLLNIHTAGIGGARVALLGADMQPLPGYSIEDCDPISADEIDCEVRWKSVSDLTALAGQTVRVQISLSHAEIFALQFTSTPR